MTVLYRIFLQLYLFAIRMAALRNEKARKWLRGKKSSWQELVDFDAFGGSLWVHCSSLGEFEQGRPLIEKLKIAYPHLPLVLTFFSPSGYDVRKNYPLADRVIHLPLDAPGNAEKLVSLIKPRLALFIKYDFWYYYFRELSSRGVPLLLVSAVFRPSQPFFRVYGGLHRKMLRYVRHFFVQDQNSGQLLQSLGYSNFTVIPDTRIDRVFEIAQTVKEFPEIEKWTGGEAVLIGGSTYQMEEEMILRLLEEKVWTGKVIIAPHHTGQKNLGKVESLFKGVVVRYSRLNQEPDTGQRILLIDNVGMLSSLYKIAAVAFIGGGFGYSIHNILEPAAFGLPILFGPNHHRFHEATTLIKTGGAFEVKTYQGVREKILFLKTEENRKAAGEAALNFIIKNRGGTEQVMSFIRQQIEL